VPVVRRDAPAHTVLGGLAPGRRHRGDRPVRAARTGTGKLGAELGVPASTVRGWLRRLRGGAGQLLQEVSSSFGLLVAVAVTREDRDPAPPGPTRSVLGPALAALAACALAAIAWHDYPERDFSALTGRFGLAAALAPAPGADRPAPFWHPVPGNGPCHSP
jgi:hypothetical protein